MAQRIWTVIPRNVFNDPAQQPINLVAGVSTLVLPQLYNDGLTTNNAPINGEYGNRSIFNAGTVNVYYNIGETCDPVTNYRAWIVPGQQLDCSDHGQAVYCWSGTSGVAPTLVQPFTLTGGTGGIVVPTQMIRRDLTDGISSFAARHTS